MWNLIAFFADFTLNPKNVVSLKNIQKLCVAMTKLSLTLLSHFQVANDYKCQNFQLHERSEMLYNNFIHLKRNKDNQYSIPSISASEARRSISIPEKFRKKVTLAYPSTYFFCISRQKVTQIYYRNFQNLDTSFFWLLVVSNY